MDKFEFSDLYKFLVSAGIVLIGLSILLPWAYLREPFDILLEKSKIELLTDKAKSIIIIRQDLISKAYYWIPKISISLFALGIASVVYGLRKWYPRQLDFDKRDRATTKIVETQANPMTPEDIEQKNKNEFKEASQEKLENAGTSTEQEAIKLEKSFSENYINIEQTISTKIQEFLKDYGSAIVNQKISNLEYDLILESKFKAAPDFIFEFKYLPYGISDKQVAKISVDIGYKQRNYFRTINQNAKIVLLIVLNNDYPNNTDSLKDFFIKQHKFFYNTELIVDIITENQVNSLDFNYFKRLLSI